MLLFPGHGTADMPLRRGLRRGLCLTPGGSLRGDRERQLHPVGSNMPEVIVLRGETSTKPTNINTQNERIRNMKTATVLLSLLAAAALLLAGCSREDASAVVQDARTTLGELVTPESGNPDNMLVVRQAKLKERRRQNTQWTPENISAHPELYLQQCQDDVKAAIDQYDAILLSLRKLRNENERKVKESEAEVARLNRFIEEAKPFYADENTAYPVTVSGFAFTKEQFVKQLRAAIKDRDRRQGEATPARQRAKAAEARISQVEKARESAEDTLRSLATKLADVKANKALSDVGGIKDTVNGILDYADGIQGGAEIPLDVLGEPSAAESDDAFIRNALGL